MRKLICCIITLLLVYGICSGSQKQEMIQKKTIKAVRGGSSVGFFSVFLYALNHLEWCLRNNFTPVIYWTKISAYYSPRGYNGSTNVREYYFEHVSDMKWVKKDPIYSKRYYHSEFSAIWFYAQYIDNLRKIHNSPDIKIIHVPGHDYSVPFFDKQRPITGMGFVGAQNQKHLYDPEFRHFVKHEILDRFVRIKQCISEKIDTFYAMHMQGKKTIGIHLRGNFLNNWEVIDVPTQYLLDAANEIGGEDYQYFIATDQQPLLDEAIQKLKGNVIAYNFKRGESTSSPLKPQQLTPEDGENMLIEAILLSKCDYFIHTLSRVSTAVLYFNPEMSHTLIY